MWTNSVQVSCRGLLHKTCNRGLLIILKVRTKTQGEASSYYCGPRLLNSLPEDPRAAESVEIFKNSRPTFLVWLLMELFLFILYLFILYLCISISCYKFFYLFKLDF